MSPGQPRPPGAYPTSPSNHAFSSLSVTVTDVMLGRAAEGTLSVLERQVDGQWTTIARGVSDSSGMILEDQPMQPGVYRLELDAEAYFTTAGITPLIPRVNITFRVPESSMHWQLRAYIAANSQFSALFRSEPPC
jgi:5-hydroxyisourate hydrolase-like protein (transthyretin family)